MTRESLEKTLLVKELISLGSWWVGGCRGDMLRYGCETEEGDLD